MFGLGCGALASSTGAGLVSAGAGGGSVSDAICGGDGLDGGAYGTGTRPLSIVTGAVALTAGEMAASCDPAVTEFVDGGTKIAALAIPADTRKTSTEPACFMAANPV